MFAKITTFAILILIATTASFAQVTQTIRGNVTKESSTMPVTGATIVVLNSGNTLAAITDSLGDFIIPNVPAGRHNLEVTALGFEQTAVKDLLVGGAKEVVLAIRMKETTINLSEITIRSKTNKELPINKMATVSARTLSVEEAARFAGGFDDPARLASSFAGVAGNIGNNGIVVRGNAPKFLQWKMEGVEIPNPNHFADMSTFGGGGLTALSSQMLANSDFFTGAFPAEYSNAVSGVFDIAMRNGNNRKHEHTFQAGIIGIDASSEGPFRKGGRSSYLFNYRYSTLSLIGPLLPENGGGVKYQDLSFKLNFPTKRSGSFTVWGIGLKDRSGATPKDDSAKWFYDSDRQLSDVQQYMGATGVSHKYYFNSYSYIKTTLAATQTGLDMATGNKDSSMNILPENRIQNRLNNIVLSSFINTRFSTMHTNKTGIVLTGLLYDLSLKNSPAAGIPLASIVSENGSSALLTAYSNSLFSITDQLTASIGINSQLFTLNDHYTIEPRAGIKWQFRPAQSLGFAYGLHSRIEQLNYYFIKDPVTNEQINKHLDFSKAHHLVASYDIMATKNIHVKVETYYQQLFNVPVIPGSSFSFINMQTDWFFNGKLANTGLGRNYGIDLTVEKYLSRGYYFLFTTSLFNAEYKGGDGIWRNSRYNRNYLFNALAGKEWPTGKFKQNLYSINVRCSYQGGDRHSPVDQAATLAAANVVYDESKAFRDQYPAAFVAHFTTSYRINRKHTSHEIALKVINATMFSEYFGYKYNYIKKTIDVRREAIFIPNLSYKIEF